MPVTAGYIVAVPGCMPAMVGCTPVMAGCMPVMAGCMPEMVGYTAAAAEGGHRIVGVVGHRTG